MTRKDLVNYAINGESAKFVDSVREMLAAKTADALDSLRSHIATSIMQKEESDDLSEALKLVKTHTSSDDSEIDKTKFWRNPKTNRLNEPLPIKGKVRKFDGYKQVDHPHADEYTGKSMVKTRHYFKKDDGSGSYYEYHPEANKRRSLSYWDAPNKTMSHFSSWDDLENHIKNNSEKKE